MYKLPAALFVLICAGLTLWWMNVGKFNGSERNLFQRLEAVLADTPPSPHKIISEFRLPKECGGKSCFFKGSKLADASYGGGDLRPTDDGLVFVLEKLAGQCIRTEMAANRFGLSEVKQACDHGGCWYREVRNDWGLLAFGLEKPESTCVSSVVINSLPYQRRIY